MKITDQEAGEIALEHLRNLRPYQTFPLLLLVTTSLCNKLERKGFDPRTCLEEAFRLARKEIRKGRR